MPRRIAIVGGGVSGLGAAWALHHHPDRFDFRLFEANEQLGGNAITADMPQDDGSAIPFDISVTACIPLPQPAGRKGVSAGVLRRGRGRRRCAGDV